MNPTRRFVLVLLLNLLWAVAFLHAQTPELINYQGKLILDGVPAQGKMIMTFFINTDSSTSTKLWCELHDDVEVSNGIFNVYLGSGKPAGCTSSTLSAVISDANKKYYLGMQIEAKTFGPFRLASAAFALRARQADSSGTGGNGWTIAGNNVYTTSISEKVGIGRSDPQGKLHLFEPNNSVSFLIENSASVANAWAKTNFMTSSANWAIGTSNQYFNNIFYVENAGQAAPASVKLAIRPDNGFVGIGTTTPNRKFHINSSDNDNLIRLSREGQPRYWDIGVALDSTIGASGSFFIGRPGIRRDFNIDSSGNAGIGTPYPKFKLDINNASLGQNIDNTVDWLRLAGLSAVANNDQLRIFHRRYANGSNWQNAEIRIQKRVDLTDHHYISFKGNAGAFSSLEFGFGNSPQMTILQNGKVGIGTSSPSHGLHLLSGAFRYEAGLDRNLYITTGQNLSSATRIQSENDNGTNLKGLELRADPIILMDGKVGIGTINPGERLEVFGSAVFRYNTGNSDFIYLSTQDPNIKIELRSGTTKGTPHIDFSNDQNIGFDARIILTSDDALEIQGASVGIGKTPQAPFSLDVNGGVRGIGAYDQTSDLRYKKNLAPIPNALDKITRLRGVSFDWRQEEFPELNFNKGRNLGFIAQEIKEVLPEVVSQDSKGYYSVAYSNVVPVLVEAIKEQQKTIQTQAQELQRTQTELENLKQRMQRLEAMLATSTDRSLQVTGQ